MHDDERTNTPNATRGLGEAPQDVTAGAGRRDEVGRTGIYPATGPAADDAEGRTPGDINAGIARGVRRDDALKRAERLPRLGNEDDKPYDDRFGE